MPSALIVTDIRLYRERVEQGLLADGRFDTVGSASGRTEARNYAAKHEPQVVLVDTAMPDSLNLIRELLTLSSKPCVVALTLRDQEDDVLACAEAGAAAYVTTDASLKDLIGTMNAAIEGELLCTPRVAASLMKRVSLLARRASENGGEEILTERELNVADLIELGCSNKEIARRLGIEVATVKNHVHNILQKLGVQSRGQAAALLRQR